MKTTSLDALVHEIMNIWAAAPGMSGTTIGVLGASPSGEVPLSQLKRHTLLLAHNIQNGRSLGDLIPEARTIEQLLYTLSLVGTMSLEQRDRLVAMLYSVVPAGDEPVNHLKK